jgi:DNA adenine methylase
MISPDEILESAYQRALNHLAMPILKDAEILERVILVSRRVPRASIRLLLACLLAKIHNPAVDIRKPYTEIGGDDSYSGRNYDEKFVIRLINKYDLPCNSTTAFLTPALRTKPIVLTPDANLGGRTGQQGVYRATLYLLTEVYENRINADDLLAEAIRQLIIYRDEKRDQMRSILAQLEAVQGDVALSAEEIVTLIRQHLASRGASRLPVLVVAAAYRTVENHLGERVLPLQGHNAADKQTGALGDVQIILTNDGRLTTCYEMKMKPVTIEDIDLAIRKMNVTQQLIDHYIFITTDKITDDVQEYAAKRF